MAKKGTGRPGATSRVSRKASKKPVGDVLGISRARVPASVPRATTDRGGNPKGIEVGRARRLPRRARTVGGVRGRGR